MKKQILIATLGLLGFSSCRSSDQDSVQIQTEKNTFTTQNLSRNGAFESSAFESSASNTVKRYYSTNSRKHFYSVNAALPGGYPNTQGWVLEGNLALLSSNYDPGQEVISLYKNGDNLLSKDANEINNARNSGFAVVESLGYSDLNSWTPVYRYFSPSKNEHFYTNNFNELGNGGSGYNYEGIAFYGAFANPN